MLKPTVENDQEFWWVKSSDGLSVVQIYADSGTLKVWGEPTFFWCGNECEEKVSAQGLVWLGKVEPPCESSICEGDNVRTEIRGRDFVGVVDEIVTEKSVKIDIGEGSSTRTLFLVNKQGEQYAETEVSCETLAQRCNDKHCPLGVFGCPFSDGIDCTKITPLHWQLYLAYPQGLPPMSDE